MSQRGRPFEPGNKFGRGRPRGSPNKTTKQVQELLNTFTEPMMKKAISESLQGNTPMLRLFIDRIMPKPREAPVKIGPLSISTAADVSRASETLLHKAAGGKLTIGQAEAFMKLLDTRRLMIVTEELEKRMSSVESKL